MKLETYKCPDNWRYPKQPKPICTHYVDDRSCETCPYPDCIATYREIMQQNKNKEEH